MGIGLSFELPDEAVEAIARRAAELVLEQLRPASPWLHGQKEIADYLAMSVSTIEKLTAVNALPVYRIDGVRRLSARRDELDEWASQYREGPPAGLRALRVVG